MASITWRTYRAAGHIRGRISSLTPHPPLPALNRNFSGVVPAQSDVKERDLGRRGHLGTPTRPEAVDQGKLEPEVKSREEQLNEQEERERGSLDGFSGSDVIGKHHVRGSQSSSTANPGNIDKPVHPLESTLEPLNFPSHLDHPVVFTPLPWARPRGLRVGLYKGILKDNQKGIAKRAAQMRAASQESADPESVESSSSLLTTSPAPFESPPPSSTMTDPFSSPTSFSSHLYNLLATSPPSPLPPLLYLHSSHPTLHSSRSYALLLAYAYRLSNFSAVRSLLRSARKEGFLRTRTGKVDEELRDVIVRGVWAAGGVGSKERWEGMKQFLEPRGRREDAKVPSGPTSGEAEVGEAALPRPRSVATKPIRTKSIAGQVYRDLKVGRVGREESGRVNEVVLGSRGEDRLGGEDKVGKRDKKGKGTAQVGFLLNPKQVKQIIRTAAGKKVVTPELVLAYLKYLLGSEIKGQKEDAAVNADEGSEAALQAMTAEKSQPTKRKGKGKGKGKGKQLETTRTTTAPLVQDAEVAMFAGLPTEGKPTLEQSMKLLEQLFPSEAEGAIEEGNSASLSAAPKLLPKHLLRLLHLHLNPDHYNRFSNTTPLDVIRTFSSTHPSIQPSPRTLTRALQCLSHYQRRDAMARQLVHHFWDTWGEGPDVVGVKSWRVVGSLCWSRRNLEGMRWAREGMRGLRRLARENREGEEGEGREAIGMKEERGTARKATNRDKADEAEAQREEERLDGQISSLEKNDDELVKELVEASAIRWRIPYKAKELRRWDKLTEKMETLKGEEKRLIKFQRVQRKRARKVDAEKLMAPLSPESESTSDVVVEDEAAVEKAATG